MCIILIIIDMYMKISYSRTFKIKSLCSTDFSIKKRLKYIGQTGLFLFSVIRFPFYRGSVRYKKVLLYILFLLIECKLAFIHKNRLKISIEAIIKNLISRTCSTPCIYLQDFCSMFLKHISHLT